VDDALEFANLASFPATGETGKIYVAIDTGFTYRWTGSLYVRINQMTNAEIKTAYEANADTNAYTDDEKTKLTGIETGATADQTNAEIKTAYEANADTNAYTDAEQTKVGNLTVTGAVNLDKVAEFTVLFTSSTETVYAGNATTAVTLASSDTIFDLIGIDFRYGTGVPKLKTFIFKPYNETGSIARVRIDGFSGVYLEFFISRITSTSYEFELLEKYVISFGTPANISKDTSPTDTIYIDRIYGIKF
jgi:hypothetical protein